MRREDYEALIDGEMWAFIRRTDHWFPPETIGLPIDRQRDIYDAMCREFHAGRPAGVLTHDRPIDAGGRHLPARHYRHAGAAPPGDDRLLPWRRLHPGRARQPRRHLRRAVRRHRLRCRLGRLPAGAGTSAPGCLRRRLATFDWAAAANDLPIVLCGESAGGNLAAAVAHARRGHARAAIGQVLIYPSLGGDMSKGSYIAHAEAPMLSTRDVLFYRDVRFGAGGYVDDPTVAPLADRDFSGLPPTSSSPRNAIRSRLMARAYRDRIRAAGGRAAWREEPGLVHSFLRARQFGATRQRGFCRHRRRGCGAGQGRVAVLNCPGASAGAGTAQRTQ